MIDRFYGLSAGLLRATSLLACLIVVISFLMFATDQLGSASSQQTAQLGDSSLATTTTAPPPGTPVTPSKPAPLRRAIASTSSRLTSPFDGFVGSNPSQWLVRSVETVLALLVYGFGMGYLVRLLRVRS